MSGHRTRTWEYSPTNPSPNHLTNTLLTAKSLISQRYVIRYCNKIFTVAKQIGAYVGNQEPITRSLHLPYKPSESTLSDEKLFIETVFWQNF